MGPGTMNLRTLSVRILTFSSIVAVTSSSFSLASSESLHLESLNVEQAREGQEADFLFRDDFTGKTLRPEWEILYDDPDRWSLYSGEYFLVVVTRDGGRVRNELRFKKELPENFELVMKFLSPFPRGEGEGHVRMALIADSKNLLELVFFTHGKEIVFSKYLRGDKSVFNERILIRKDKPYFLKIVKSGIEYSGYFSLDGRTWTEVGTHILLRFGGKLHIGAWTGTTQERGVKFDFVQIKEID
jgi:hypothetical protein